MRAGQGEATLAPARRQGLVGRRQNGRHQPTGRAALVATLRRSHGGEGKAHQCARTGGRAAVTNGCAVFAGWGHQR